MDKLSLLDAALDKMLRTDLTDVSITKEAGSPAGDICFTATCDGKPFRIEIHKVFPALAKSFVKINSEIMDECEFRTSAATPFRTLSGTHLICNRIFTDITRKDASAYIGAYKVRLNEDGWLQFTPAAVSALSSEVRFKVSQTPARPETLPDGTLEFTKVSTDGRQFTFNIDPEFMETTINGVPVRSAMAYSFRAGAVRPADIRTSSTHVVARMAYDEAASYRCTVADGGDVYLQPRNPVDGCMCFMFSMTQSARLRSDAIENYPIWAALRNRRALRGLHMPDRVVFGQNGYEYSASMDGSGGVLSFVVGKLPARRLFGVTIPLITPTSKQVYDSVQASFDGFEATSAVSAKTVRYTVNTVSALRRLTDRLLELAALLLSKESEILAERRAMDINELDSFETEQDLYQKHNDRGGPIPWADFIKPSALRRKRNEFRVARSEPAQDPGPDDAPARHI